LNQVSSDFGVARGGAKAYSPKYLNTPRQVYDDQQQLRWKWDQAEPFGVTTPDENPASLGAFELPLRFPGQYADKETNLAYNQSRDYDPSVGRYIESDPFGLFGGLGTYTYARGSALQFVDVNGELEPITTCLIVSATFYVTMAGASKVQKFIYNGQLTSQASQTAAVANKVCQEQKTQAACNLVKDSDVDLLRGSAATAGAAASFPGALGGGAAPGGNVDIRRTVDILQRK
jgi:RHS repeat-associated protein